MGSQQKPSSQKEQKPYNTFLKYTSLGLQMVITIALAGAIGYWIDSSLGIQFPAFLLSFIILSLAGIIILLIKNLD